MIMYFWKFKFLEFCHPKSLPLTERDLECWLFFVFIHSRLKKLRCAIINCKKRLSVDWFCKKFNYFFRCSTLTTCDTVPLKINFNWGCYLCVCRNSLKLHELFKWDKTFYELYNLFRGIFETPTQIK